MSRWFRFYDDALNDPKAQKLSDSAFRGWVNLLCLASKHDGMLEQPIENIAFSLRKSLPKTRELLQLLQSVGLMDRTENGWKPHNWDARQFKSDVSTERVKRFRKRQETVSETPPDTEQIQSRTESEKVTPPAAPAGGLAGEQRDFELEAEEPTPPPPPKPKKPPKAAAPEIPDWLPQEQWGAFLDMRKRIRAPLTDRGITLAIGALERLRAEGHDPGGVLDQSILKNWRGLFALPPGTAPPAPMGGTAMSARLEEAQRAEEEHQRRKLEGADHVH